MSNNAKAITDALPPIATFECNVKCVTPLSANSFQVDLTSPKDVTLTYLAGHYLKLELDVNCDGNPLLLSYSIANDPCPEHKHRLQIFVQNTGDFVEKILKRLSEKVKNDGKVSVTLPMGLSFLQTDLNLPHVLVAAGSGIAKIRCLTEAILKQNPNADLRVYWSNRNVDDFYLLDEFKALDDQHEKFSFTPILETADADWSGRSGYIYEVLLDDIKNFFGVKSYLCGSPQMVYGTIDKLKYNGLKEDDCYSDVFEYAPRK